MTQRPPQPSGVVTAMGLTICLLLWLLFAAAMLADRASLDAVWVWFRARPVAVEAILGLLLLPWTVALLIWQAPWPAYARLPLIASVALVNLYAFLPWSRGGKE